MPPPSNTTYSTAIDIPTFPASISQNVYDAGTTYTVWYKFTAPVTGVMGIFGFGDLVFGYSVVVNIITDPGGTPVTVATGYNAPVMVPVTLGVDYYLECESLYGDYDPSQLLLTVKQFAPQAIPYGSILVNSDQGGQPCAILSAANGDDYNVLDLPFPFTFGESGCIVRSSGNFLLSQEFTGELILYDSNFSVLDTISYDMTGINTDGIRASQTLGKFYAGKASSPATIQVINGDGTLGTLYTLPGANINSLAPSNDGSIIYVAGNGLAGHGVGGPIKRFLTASSTFGTDLAAGVTNYSIGSLLVLDDDSIIALYRHSTNSPLLYAVRFAFDGTVLNTYNIVTGNVSQPRLAFATNSLTSFWVWYQNLTPSGQVTFQEIQVSDGAVLKEVIHIKFNDNRYTAEETATPLTDYGPSDSCPFIILGAGEEPPPVTTGTIIVEKVTVPSDETLFDFTAGGGLDPTTFQLADGQTQTYSEVEPGSGYSIVETTNPAYTTVYSVSNGSPNTNISVAIEETVTVTVTNTLANPNPGEGNGIYQIVPNKRYDTLWVNFPSTTQNVKIP